jgi:hypothetical protein
VTRAEAAALAAVLELDVEDIAICHACLSFVCLAIDSGSEHQVAGSITRMAPDLWAEGLAQPVRLALERARKRLRSLPCSTSTTSPSVTPASAGWQRWPPEGLLGA